MPKRNEYRATWADGRTLRFVSTDRKSAAEARELGRIAA